MRFLLLFVFLQKTDAQEDLEPQSSSKVEFSTTQSFPESFIPALGNIQKVIDVTFTHNLPSSFDLREEDDYTWPYFTAGMFCHVPHYMAHIL